MGLLSVDLSAREELKRSLPVEQRTGVTFPRYFTAKLQPGKTPYDEVVWEKRTATIGNDKGAVIFEQRDIEVFDVGPDIECARLQVGRPGKVS